MPVVSYAENHKLDIEWTEKQLKTIREIREDPRREVGDRAQCNIRLSKTLRERAKERAKDMGMHFEDLIESMLKIIVDSADN